jgi:hypothetical protein
MTDKPILAVDVDGVVNALSSNPLPEHRFATVSLSSVQYNPGHGQQLLAIAKETGAELTWLTHWKDNANEHISPLIGLPCLPVVPLEPAYRKIKLSQRDVPGLVKSIALRIYAAGRPFCWLDDEPPVIVATFYSQPHLIISVDPCLGLQPVHLEQARKWLTNLKES